MTREDRRRSTLELRRSRCPPPPMRERFEALPPLPPPPPLCAAREFSTMLPRAPGRCMRWLPLLPDKNSDSV